MGTNWLLWGSAQRNWKGAPITGTIAYLTWPGPGAAIVFHKPYTVDLGLVMDTAEVDSLKSLVPLC